MIQNEYSHLNMNGMSQFTPRPYFDNYRQNSYRNTDECGPAIGGVRSYPRDVSFPYWPSLPLAPPMFQPPPMIGVACQEEGECFLPEKQLKKSKRIRTRVDAGEPRNPYSAAASVLASVGSNLCSGVSVASVTSPYNNSGGRYPSCVQTWWRGATPNNNNFQNPMTYCASAAAATVQPLVHYISQPQQSLPHCLSRQRQGSAAAMLSELFANHKNTNSVADTMGILDKLANSKNEATAALLRGPEPDNVLLREILQGRKRDLLTIEEIEAARAMHQNINNNNSPIYKNSSSVEITKTECSVDESTREHNTSHDSAVEDDDMQCESGNGTENTDGGDSGSPDSSAECGESKKSRLESIVSVMRSSTPPMSSAINGCKKRKLYLPQQHDSRLGNDSTSGSSSISGSPSSQPSSPQPPGSKSRKIDNQEVHDIEDEGADLQIDLSLRNESKLRDSRDSNSPDLPRSSSPKLSSNECSDMPPMYLLDYAKHLLNTRAQHTLQQNNNENDLSHKLSILRSLGGDVSNAANEKGEFESLKDLLKTEITASLTVMIDDIVNKFINQRKNSMKQIETSASVNSHMNTVDFTSIKNLKQSSKPNPMHLPQTSTPQVRPPIVSENSLNNLNLPPHLRPQLYKPSSHLFSSSLPPVSIGQTSPFSNPEPEQDEALSLVVTPKKKRHKVTDSRLTPRTVGRLLEDLPRYSQITPSSGCPSPRFNSPPSPPPTSLPPHSLALTHGLQHPHLHVSRPNLFHQPPPPLLPVSLPTSVAIPNPSLHDPTSLLYSGVYYNRGPISPPDNRREGSPVGSHLPPHPPPHPLLHPFLAASNADSFSHFLKGNDDRNSDCSPGDSTPFDQHALSFYADREYPHSSTLTPMHLRKAKLMFFFCRYPSSSVLKTFFPDIKFNKNNTAQLVKWFSNFREFYYIQMEKHARQALSEGMKSADDISVAMDSELIRVLNLHYNRNNHLEIPNNFRFVCEQTLKEFFKAIQDGKDAESSWKKSIYKIIARLDEGVPDYFKAPTFLEQLE